MNIQIHNSDCLDVMRGMDANSIDAIVTDPPYGLNFMGKDFDNPKMMGQSAFLHGGLNNYPQDEKRKGYADCDMVKFQSYMTPIFAEALRVSKPGAHILAFGGSRTYHRMACAIEDAGWEIRDCIMWVYGSGFPKSMDVGKAIDKHLGAERKVVGVSNRGSGASWVKLENHSKGDTGIGMLDGSGKTFAITAPASDEAKKWNGYGTCLKPAFEPVIVARKPLDGTVASNVLKWGTGALNIDGCRVPTDDNLNGGAYSKNGHRSGLKGDIRNSAGAGMFAPGKTVEGEYRQPLGRFPANLVHDGSDEVLACFPESKGQCGAVKGDEPSELTRSIYGKFSGGRLPFTPRGDSGSAARFFYCAKASRSERGEGNGHPTVKPLALMRWLITLVAPPNAVVFDPFMGSGTTGIAAVQLGRRFIGVEREAEYYEIAERRIASMREGELELKYL